MIQFIITAIRDMAPIAWVALGAVFAFRVGIFHLGLEGLMCAGAFTGVAVTIGTGNVWLGVGAAVVLDLLLSLLYWLVVVKLQANVIIAGLGLTGIGVAGATFAQVTIFSTQGTIQAPAGLPTPLSVPVTSAWTGLSSLSVLVWLVPLVVFGVWLLVRRSHLGLRMTAVGDYPFAARSAGAKVDRTKLVALLICGAMCAIGGSELALGGLHSFSQGMTAGRGYIAFTAVVFGAAHPIGTALAALFFGMAEALGISAQLQHWEVPLEFVLALPYVLTIVAVAIAGRLSRRSAQSAAGYSELKAT